MADQTNRKKHTSYAKQRELCRLNKHTYEEKCSTCSQNFLMCNFPFPEPDHKKGFCRASTCTDMREIPAAIVEADKQEENTGDSQSEPLTHNPDEANNDAGAGKAEGEDNADQRGQ